MARAPVSAAADVVAVLVFVLVGRRNHDEGVAAAGIAETAAPFLIGLAAGWLVARAWRAPTAFATGAVVWVFTVVIGLVLRRTVFDGGTALAFVVVATVTIGALLLGWRALAGYIARRNLGT